MNRQDWNRRFANNALCNTPKQKVFQAGTAMSAHHDQIDFLLGRKAENLRRRVPACDENLVSNSCQLFARYCLQPVSAF